MSQSNKKKNTFLKIILRPEIGILIPILILCVFTALSNKNFLTWNYISSILTASVYIGVAALGASLILISGEIDLSLGQSGCFAGIMVGVAVCEWGFTLIPALLVGLMSGMIVGLVNGLLTTRVGLSSWIATLAVQYICTGASTTITNGEPFSLMSLNLSSFNRAKPLGLTWLFFIFIALLLIVYFVMTYTRFGYKVYTVGANKDAALYAGINVKNIKLIVFILAGLFAAIGGIFDVVYNSSANVSYGSGREFRAFSCCAIGGINMAGGEGSILGVGLGVLLFHVLWYCLRILGVDTNLQLVLIGFILVLAVALNSLRKKVEAKSLVD